MVTVSVDESPVMVMLAPAVKVRVSEVVSATGLVPEVVAIVVKTFWSPVLVPERLEPVTAPAQAKAPVALVKVQPVEPDPPPRRMSPVPVLFILKAPVPLASRERAMLVSPQVAARVTPPPVAALAMVISLTAEAAEVNLKNSLPLVSRISAPVNLRSPDRAVVAAVKVIELSPKAMVVSVPDEASKTQLMAEPAPQVVVATSVESKFKVTVVVVPESETTVSMPLGPPTISRRSPATKVVSVPVSAPTSKSVVSVSASVPQVKTLATVSSAVQVVKEESPKVTEELSKRRAPSTSNVPSIYASSPFRETVGAALPTLRLPPKTLNNPAAERVSVIEPSP